MQTNATATARAFRRDERALDDDDDRGEIPRAAGITASFSGTTRPVLSLSVFLSVPRTSGFSVSLT